MIKVRFINGEIETYKTRQEAEEDILEKFTESGENMVDDVLEVKGHKKISLGCSWQVRLDSTNEYCATELARARLGRKK